MDEVDKGQEEGRKEVAINHELTLGHYANCDDTCPAYKKMMDEATKRMEKAN